MAVHLLNVHGKAPLLGDGYCYRSCAWAAYCDWVNNMQSNSGDRPVYPFPEKMCPGYKPAENSL
jgi:hypothetical protein